MIKLLLIFALMFSPISNSAIRDLDKILEEIDSGRKETIICGGVGARYVEYNMSITNIDNKMSTNLNFNGGDGSIVIPITDEYNDSVMEMLNKSGDILKTISRPTDVLVGVVLKDPYVVTFYIMADKLRMGISDERKMVDIDLNLARPHVGDLYECLSLTKSVMNLY